MNNQAGVLEHGTVTWSQRARTWYRRLETCKMNNQAGGLEHATVAWRAITWYRCLGTCKTNNQAGGLEHGTVAWGHVRRTTRPEG